MIDIPQPPSQQPRREENSQALNVLTRLLAFGRPLVMGILNVTPDSFSDGGRFHAPQDAIAQARRISAEGADILDIGAESTRPYGGAVKISAAEEWSRLQPVLPAITALGIPVSVDTMKSEVASAALDMGAAMINDVWGLQRDAQMAPLVAARSVPIIIMHNRDAPDPAIDIINDICEFFSRSLDIAARAGIPPDRIILDPGIGFGKTPGQSMTAIARLGELKSFGLPLLVGASRKRFIDAASPSPPDRRLGGSIASHLLAIENGATIVRTHDVADSVQALRVAAAIRGTG